MNSFENECNEALKKENAKRIKDGLEPRPSNITFIDYTKEVRKDLEIYDKKTEEELEKRRLIYSSANGVRIFGFRFWKLKGKIKYKINKINKRRKTIIFDKNIYLVELHKLSKKCDPLSKKYIDIARKIEEEQLETCPETCLEKYVEESDVLELQNIYNKFTKIWNKYVAFINKEIIKKGVNT